MFSKLSMQLKLFLAFGSTTIVSLLLVGIVSYCSMKETTVEMVKGDLQSKVEGVFSALKIAYDINMNNQRKASSLAAHFFVGKSQLAPKKKLDVVVENQITKQKEKLKIPAMLVNGKVMNGNNKLIAEIASYTFTTVTFFQMIPQGMLRIATNIRKSDGALATGTYVPKTSPVYQKVIRGETFYGRAFVVDGWYITAYRPIKDLAGKIVGAIYTGISENNIEEFKKEIRSKKIMGTGYYYVLDSKGDLIVHPAKEGENIIDAKDADGRTFIKEIVEHKDGVIIYPWTNDANVAPKDKIVVHRYFSEMDWIIAAGVDLDRFYASINKLKINVIVTSFIVLLFVIGLVLLIGRSITRPVFKICNSLNESASSIANAAQELEAAGQSLTSASQEQAAATQESVSAMSEMKSMIEQTNDFSEKSQELAGEIRNMTDTGNEVMKELEMAMNHITEMGQKMSEMATIISDISIKTDVINEIVFKTQLLSFNASIEAARAGQHGKGFAVVAEEVGNLAQMSGTAAEEIKRLLENSQNQVGNTVEVTQATVEKGQDVARRALEIFSNISEKVANINEKIGQIVGASREQALGISQTTEALKQLDIATKNNDKIAIEAKNNASRLTASGGELAAIVKDLTSVVVGRAE